MHKKILKLELLITNLLFLAIFVASAVWGGSTQTGSGLTIPNSPLIVPFFLFLVGSLLQAVCLRFKSAIPFYVLSCIKLVLVEIAIYLIAGYALSDFYINAVANGNFFDHIWNSRMVSASMILTAVAFALETVGFIINISKNRLGHFRRFQK